MTRIAGAWLVCLLLIACSAGSTAAPSTTVATSPSPIATVAPAATPSPTTSEAAINLKPGEPWLLYRWYPGVLYVVRPDGSDRQRLQLGATLGTGEPFEAAWAPDGDRIGFIVRDDSKTPRDSIWTANADGTNAALFYDGDGACDDGANYPSWSPDG